MSEVGVTSDASAVLLLYLWWALLSVLGLLFGSADPGGAGQRTAGSPPDDDLHGTGGNPRSREVPGPDAQFDADSFLKGARRAYEAVLHAYALGDLKTLGSLLSVEVLAAFTEACARRRERNETLEMTVIGIEAAEIADIAATSETMDVTVRFRAEIVCVERSISGAAIDGNENAVTTTADLWTFSRTLSGDVNGWRIVATDEG